MTFQFSVKIITLATLALWLPSQLAAATCNVPGEYTTIQAAVDDLGCNPIVVSSGSFPDAVVAGRDVVIQGSGQGATFLGETVTIDNDAEVGLRSLSIQFTSGAGVFLASKFATLKGEDIEISFNPGAGVDFGPLAADALADLRNCLISDNQTGVNTRFIYMNNCTVLLNRPAGGIRVGVGGDILNSTITANENTSLTGDGGGILLDGIAGVALDVEDSTITGNISNSSSPMNNTSDGGGIMARQGFLFLRRSEVRGNVAGRWGGGVANSTQFGSNIEIYDSIIEQNIAYGSGGGIAGGDRLEIYRSTVSGNFALYNDGENANGLGVGGGIYAFGDRLTLKDSRLVGNQARTQTGQVATFDGGGLYVLTPAGRNSLIQRSSIINNQAEGDGGGVWVGSETTMENVTIAGNEADGDGGGIYGSGALNIAHGTIVDNSAGGDGGGIASSAVVNHTVIGHNQDTSAGPDFHPDCSGGIVSTGFSLLRIDNGCAQFDGGPNNGSGSSGNPLNLALLRPAADNGGPVETVALDPRSPAVDAGEGRCETAVSTDARGFSRLAQDGNRDGGVDNDLCDLGAFEVFTGCQTAPLLLQGFVFDTEQVILSETTLSTGPTVTVGQNGDVRFVAANRVSLGPGFSTEPGGTLTIAVDENVRCD